MARVQLEDFNTIGKIAKRWRCSPKTVRRLIDCGAISVVRVGRIVRLTADAVKIYEKRNPTSKHKALK